MDFFPILLLALMMLVFWFVVMRPARRQQQQVADLQRNLAVGDRVVLSAGIFGTLTELGEQRVSLEIAPGTVVEVARQVVVRKADDQPAGESHLDDGQPGTAPHSTD